MSAVCPSNEVDELTISLLTIFDHRGLSFELLETLIKQEIEETGKGLAFVPRLHILTSSHRERVRNTAAHMCRNKDALGIC